MSANEQLFSAAAVAARSERAFADVPLADVRRFWEARPCNLRHSPAPVGSAAFFADVEARKYRVEPHIAPFADFARWRCCDVLEVGCGLGTESVNFARAGARLVALDLSPRSVELTRQRLAQAQLSATVLEADAECMTATLAAQSGVPAQFDLVVVVWRPSPHAGIYYYCCYCCCYCCRCYCCRYCCRRCIS